MRTIVDLPAEQLDGLAHLCSAQNISRAEAVRRAVAAMLERESGTQVDTGFGLWRHKRITSRKMVDKLRQEWRER